MMCAKFRRDFVTTLLPLIAVACAVSTARGEYNYMDPPRPAARAVELAVRKVVEQHIAGIVKRDAQQISDAWDTKVGSVTFVGHDSQGKEVIEAGPVADSIKLWTSAKRPSRGEIVSVDVVGDKMAFAKAKIQFNGRDYDDYLVLLAVNGTWKLVSKTYSPADGGLVGGYGVSRAQRD